MLTKIFKTILITTVLIFGSQVAVVSQSFTKDYNDDDGREYNSRARIDRFLDAEVWVNHSDGEYYEGDEIVIHFRSNSDAFVAIYSIDSRGRVNLLFPSESGENNYIRGGVTYSLPGNDDDYNLSVTGPEGFENIQIISSRERFDIPNWYHNSGLVADDDRHEYMDYLNNRYFVRYSGQKFAYDRAAIYVNEWEDNYYQPVYYPHYPSWSVYGNMYIDYGWGSTVYVNGIYWGIAPLYVPRIAVGWHVISVYDYNGYCWESDFHVSRYNTVVFNKTVIRPRVETRSKYKEVRQVGYRSPAKHGYPNYKKGIITTKSSPSGKKITRGGSQTGGKTISRTVISSEKKYARGSSKVIKTDRGYETDASNAVYKQRKTTTRTGRTARTGSTNRSGSDKISTGKTKRSNSSGSDANYRKSRNSGSNSVGTQRKRTSGTSEGYYRKKTGSSSRSGRSGDVKRQTNRKTNSGSTVKRQKTSSSKKEKSSGSYKQSSSKKSKGSSKTVKQPSQKKSSNKGSGKQVKSQSKKSSGKSKSISKNKSSGSKSKKKP